MNALLLLAQDDGAAPLIFGGGCFLVWALMSLVILIFWVWALVDAIRNQSLSNNERIIWVLVILFTSLLGALLYLIIGRKGTAMQGPSPPG